MSVLTQAIEPNAPVVLKTLVVKPQAGHLHKDDLAACVQFLSDGGVIIFPTDTVYGIGCNAFHPEAIRKIYQLKGRSYTKPLPVLLAEAAQLPLMTENVHRETRVTSFPRLPLPRAAPKSPPSV